MKEKVKIRNTHEKDGDFSYLSFNGLRVVYPDAVKFARGNVLFGIMGGGGNRFLAIDEQDDGRSSGFVDYAKGLFLAARFVERRQILHDAGRTV